MPDRVDMGSPGLAGHGAGRLGPVHIDTYNAELRSAEGFIGDRASSRAFRAILDDARERTRGDQEDPLGEKPAVAIGKRKLDRLLVDGDVLAAGIVLGAIEAFAAEFAGVIRRFLRLKSWRDTERIVVGGGLRDSRVGELAIGRAAAILRARDLPVELWPIRHHPDEAGLLGACHLAPAWIFGNHDSLLAVDIGGSNIRAGIVETNAKRAPDLSAARVAQSELWRHADERPTREEAVARLGAMLTGLVRAADKQGLHLAPFVGIGCPGLIRDDGSIARGGQNLPGNWESARFNLPERLREMLPRIGGFETVALIHNDAVVQGLSEAPFMQDVRRWGVLTIGTGLGNARFTNAAAPGG